MPVERSCIIIALTVRYLFIPGFQLVTVSNSESGLQFLYKNGMKIFISAWILYKNEGKLYGGV
jgi:hypothetical protein